MKTISPRTQVYILIGSLLVMQLFYGCKKFLDVNENPNNPVNASPELLLPTVEAAVGQLVGNNFQIYGNFWAQYWTQSPSSSQYRTIDQYRIANTAFDRSWSNLYRGALQNAQIIINSQEAGNAHIKGMAYVLKAYTFQLATDAFGDIPLSEAVQGNQITSPRYEKQQVVYDSIFKFIDTGIAMLQSQGSSSPGSQDIIFQSDIGQWISFARTLKLRAYLRLSEIQPELAASGIAALYRDGGTFLQSDASINYSATGGNENPLYNEMLGLGRTQNIVASATAVGAMRANADPRLFKFYEPLAGSDTIAYIQQGTYSSNTDKEVSPPSALVGANANSSVSATSPVKLISLSESYFLQAEAVARGWAPGTVATLFTSGIRSSFESLSIASQADAYISTAPDAQLPGDIEGNIRSIITQKYYAMCGFQGFEAWTEWRRTGYPEFLRPSAASTIGGNRMPLRFLYPNSELTTNQNFPGTQLIYVPVWWDVD
jgi:hypothetical protein